MKEDAYRATALARWCVIGGVVLSGCAEPPSLDQFVFEADSLPGCQIAVIPEGAPLPCGLTQNPYIGTEGFEVGCFARMVLAPPEHDHAHDPKDGPMAPPSDAKLDSLVEALDQILFSVYQGKGEAGVFGFRFRTEAAARAAGEALRLRAAVGENGMVEESGGLVAYIWYDGEGSECGFRLRDLIRDRLE